jgi:hypothetical protein
LGSNQLTLSSERGNNIACVSLANYANMGSSLKDAHPTSFWMANAPRIKNHYSICR